MKEQRGLPIPAIVALATVVAGGIGIWRGLSQGTAEVPPVLKSPIESPLEAPLMSQAPVREPTNGPLAGLVRLPDGAPAAAAKVRARVASYVGKPMLQAPAVPQELEIVADDQGHFTFEVPLAWSWTLSAHKDGMVGIAVEVMPPDESVVIPLSGAQAVRVTVQEKNGLGVLNVPVGMTAVGKAAPAFEGTTDAAGRVSFDKVPLGKWRVDAVENVGGKNVHGKMVMRERRRAQQMFELQATAMGEVVLQFASVGKVRGKVVAPAGVDLARLIVYGVPSTMARAMQSQEYGAQLDLLPVAYPGTWVAADGRFELVDVSGPQGLIVPHPTLIHSTVVAEPDGAEVKVTLFKDKAVTGRVVDQAGNPVTSFAVNSAGFNSSEGKFEYVHGGRPGAERPKNLPLIVTADGFQPLEKHLVLGDGDTDVGTLQLQPGRTFTLKVTEEQGGAPVDELTFVRLDGTALMSEPSERLSAGVYRFSRLPNALTTLSMTRFGGATRKIQVAPGDVERSYQFGAGATLRGVVKGGSGKPAVGARVFPSGDLRATRLTDPEGRYSFAGLEAGPMTLVVTFGRANAVKKIEVPPSGELVVNFEMPATP